MPRLPASMSAAVTAVGVPVAGSASRINRSSPVLVHTTCAPTLEASSWHTASTFSRSPRWRPTACGQAVAKSARLVASRSPPLKRVVLGP